MLAYAANSPQVAVRRSSPRTLLLIAAAHVAVLALIVTAKSDLPQRIVHTPISVTLVPEPPPPPAAHVTKPRVVQPVHDSAVPQPPPINVPQVPVANPMPKFPDIGGLVGPGAQPQPRVEPQPTVHAPAPTPAWLLTPTSELKPPYPEAKLLTGEEASLTLRLSIDEHGRVMAVDPVGRFDPVFLAAARRHLLAHWRYKPAIKDGRATASTTLVTLRFELDS